MPVSKKRKKKGQKPQGPPVKSGVVAKPKLSKQRILLYIISAVMIISLAASFLVGAGGGHTGVTNQAAPQTSDGNNLLTDPPAANAGQEEDTTGVEAETEGATQSEDAATESE